MLVAFCIIQQTKSQTIDRKITGIIADVKNNETLPFAAVSIYNTVNTTAAIKSTQSADNGVFNFMLPAGEYLIKVSSFGYQSKTITKLFLTEEKPILDLGMIYLSSDTRQLEEVVVEFKKPIVEIQDDKIVYNVDQSIFAEGGVATDVLKNVPMVQVDIDGKATIAGKRNTRIFIDGKPSDYSPNSIGDLLSILPSDALESVEVITDPSSKFDSDGDGIINIVLKKAKKIGLTGNLSSTAGTQGNYNMGSFLSNKKTKFSYTANAGFNHGNRLSNGLSNRSNFFADTTFYIDQTNGNERLTNGFNARFGGSLLPDTGKTIRFNIRTGYNASNSTIENQIIYLNEQQVNASLRSQFNDTQSNNFDVATDVDYDVKAKNNNNYSFGLNFNKNNSNNIRDNSRYFYNADGSPAIRDPTLQVNDFDDISTNLQLTADYDKSFTKLSGRLEAGFKTDLSSTNNDQLVQSFDFLTNQYVLNPSLTNTFKFNQNIYAGYISYRFKLGKWGFRAGNRTEITDVNFIQQTGSNINIKPYLNFFPSFAVNRNFKGKYNLGVNYSRRISRPRPNTLNPLIDNSDPLNIRFGNPDLIASFTDQYELNFGIYEKEWSISPRLSYSIANKIIERIRTINQDGSSETTFKNLANSNALNFNLFGNYRAGKKKTFNAGITLSKITYNSVANTTLNRSGTNIRANAGLNYTFSRFSAFEGNLNFIRNTEAQGVTRGSVGTQFGFRQNMFKNKMGLRLTAIDPFNQKNNTITTEGINFYQQSFLLQRTRNFTFSLSYRFTKIINVPTKK